MKKLLLLLIINLLILSCNTHTKESWNPENIIQIGKTKDTIHKWCGIVPAEDKYSYRVDKWSFLTEDSLKIAEGEYKVYINWIWDKGGCPYDYFENSIDLDSWEFWDFNGDKIEPTRKLIKLIDFKVKNEEKGS